MTLEFIPQRKFIIAGLVAIFILYVIFQSRNFLIGPVLKITYPTENQTVAGPVIEVRGQARNVSFITLNNKTIFIDDEGEFKESLLMPEGMVILRLKGKDRFGREKQTTRTIVVKNENKAEILETTATTSKP